MIDYIVLCIRIGEMIDGLFDGNPTRQIPIFGMGMLWETENQSIAQILTLSDDNHTLTSLRNSVICHINKCYRGNISCIFKISNNLLNCLTFSQTQDAFDIFGDKEFGLFDFDCVIEKTIKLVAIIFQRSHSVCKRKTLARKSADNNIGIRECGNINILNIITYDVVTNIFSVCSNGIFINVIGPNNCIAGLNQS